MAVGIGAGGGSCHGALVSQLSPRMEQAFVGQQWRTASVEGDNINIIKSHVTPAGIGRSAPQRISPEQPPVDIGR